MTPQSNRGSTEKGAEEKSGKATASGSKASGVVPYDPLGGANTMRSIKLLRSAHDDAYEIVVKLQEQGAATDGIDSISALMIQGALAYLKVLRKKHNQNSPFPPFLGRLPKGTTQVTGETRQQTINLPENLVREINGFMFRSITARRTKGEYLGGVGSLVDFWTYATQDRVATWTKAHGTPGKVTQVNLRAGRPSAKKEKP